MKNLTQLIQNIHESERETFEVVYPDGTMHSFYYTQEDAEKCVKELEKENPDPAFKPTIKRGLEKLQKNKK